MKMLKPTQLRMRTQNRLRQLAAALAAWAGPSSNPFLMRALRIEARRHKPFWTVACFSLLLLLAVVAVLWLWNFVQGLPTSGPNARLREGIFGIFSDNPINWMAIAASAVSAYGVLWCVRARAAFLLRQELLKNTLVQLQQLPLAEERWAWLLAAHPAMLGLLVGCCGLPMFAIAVFTGQWSLLDVLALLVLFCFLSHALPAWQPSLWQQPHHRQTEKKGWREWQEKLRHQRNEHSSRSEKWEAQHRSERAAAGVGSGRPPESTLGSGTSTIFNPRARNRAGWGIMGWVWILFAINGMVSVALRGGNSLVASWPREATSLLPALPVTWPLFAARMLVAPLDFFAFQLPPLLLMLPLWLAYNHQAFVALGAQLSSAETFWTQPRVQRRTAVGAGIAALLLLLVLGYGWPLFIENALLAKVLGGAPVTPSHAEAALCTLLVVAATIGAALWQELVFKRALFPEAQTPMRVAFGKAAQIVAGAPLVALLVYFVFCALGARSGLSAPATARLPILFCTCVAFLLACFGTAAVGATLTVGRRRLWTVLRAMWFLVPALSVLIHTLALAREGRLFTFADAPHVLSSPVVTLLALFRSGAPLTPAADVGFWSALLLQAVIGTLMLAVAARKLFSSVARLDGAEPGETTPGKPDLPGRIVEPLYALERVAVTAVSRVVEALFHAVDRFHSLNDNIVRWGESGSNAVLTYELRRRVRKENWLALWLVPLLGGLIIFIFTARPWELWTIGAVGNGGVVRGGYVWNYFTVWGAQVTITALVVTWGFGLLLAMQIGRAFDSDRANGTLVFLLLTPQTDRQILFGKLLSGVLPITIGISSGFIWLATATLAGSFLGGDKVLLWLAMAGVLALAASLASVSTINLYFAVRARKPTEGQSWALLFCLIWKALMVAAILYLSSYLERISQIRYEILACPLLILTALINLALAYAAWHLTLRAFARRRYGDVEASGKSAN